MIPISELNQNITHFLGSERPTSANTGSFTPGIYKVTSHSAWREDVEAEPCSLYEYRADLNASWAYRFELNGSALVPMVLLFRDLSIPSQAENYKARALQKAYGRIRKADIGLGESLGEYKETIAMLRNPLKGLREFLTDNRFKNLNSLYKLGSASKNGRQLRSSNLHGIGVAADTWLELRYGLRPLVMTIVDVMKQVAKKQSEIYNAQTIRSVHATQSGEIDSSFDELMSRAHYFDFLLDAKSHTKVKARASVQYRQSKPPGTAAKFGLSPEFLPETVFELTKLSFVLDWLFTVGPWLSSLRIKPYVEILGNTVSVKVDRTVTVRSRTRPAQSPYMAWSSGPKGEYRLTKYERAIHQSLPTTPLFTAGDVIDLYKTIDSLALILQPLLRRLRRM